VTTMFVCLSVYLSVTNCECEAICEACTKTIYRTNQREILGQCWGREGLLLDAVYYDVIANQNGGQPPIWKSSCRHVLVNNDRIMMKFCNLKQTRNFQIQYGHW